VFDIPPVGDTGPVSDWGHAWDTNRPRALEAKVDWPSRVGAMGLQRVVTPAASNLGCEANVKS
jgi:hypothetical protein